jgi:hypothetical protein
VKFDCFQYWPAYPITMEDVKAGLPDQMRAELLQGSMAWDYGVMVEASKSEVVQSLDAYFEIGASEKFIKQRYVEVTKDAIDEFAFYFVEPKIIDQGRGVSIDFDRPSCATEMCYFGARVIHPMRVQAKKIEKIQIAIIKRSWTYDSVELILSRDLKEKFEDYGVIGLEYEECLAVPPAKGRVQDQVVVAMVRTVAPQTARCIVLNEKYYCRQHSFAINPFLIDLATPRATIPTTDFLLLNRVTVNTIDYHTIPRWAISKKVLTLLLGEKVSGLGKVGFYFGERFLPLVVD